MNISRVIKCQIPSESVKNEINRIVGYMSVYPDEHLYVVDSRYGAIPYWSMTGVQSIREYYTGIMTRDNEDMPCSLCSEPDAPVWMCNDEVVKHMETAGLVTVAGEEAYATSWLMEYGRRNLKCQT